MAIRARCWRWSSSRVRRGPEERLPGGATGQYRNFFEFVSARKMETQAVLIDTNTTLQEHSTGQVEGSHSVTQKPPPHDCPEWQSIAPQHAVAH